MQRLLEEDNALILEQDEASHEMRLKGVNDEHLNTVLARLKRSTCVTSIPLSVASFRSDASVYRAGGDVWCPFASRLSRIRSLVSGTGTTTPPTSSGTTARTWWPLPANMGGSRRLGNSSNASPSTSTATSKRSPGSTERTSGSLAPVMPRATICSTNGGSACPSVRATCASTSWIPSLH